MIVWIDIHYADNIILQYVCVCDVQSLKDEIKLFIALKFILFLSLKINTLLSLF